MEEIDKLRVLLPHWIEHNGVRTGEFGDWAERAAGRLGLPSWTLPACWRKPIPGSKRVFIN